MPHIKSPIDYHRSYASPASVRSKTQRINWSEIRKYAVEVIKLVLIVVMVIGFFSMLFITRPPEKSKGKEVNQSWHTR